MRLLTSKARVTKPRLAYLGGKRDSMLFPTLPASLWRGDLVDLLLMGSLIQMAGQESWVHHRSLQEMVSQCVCSEMCGERLQGKKKSKLSSLPEVSFSFPDDDDDGWMPVLRRSAEETHSTGCCG